MRVAFRLAALLLTFALVMLYYGVGSMGMLPGPRGEIEPTQSACSDAVTVTASDSLTWSSTAIGPVCQNTTFTVENTGNTNHTFTVSSFANAVDNSTSDTSFFSWPHLFAYKWLTGVGTSQADLTVTIHFWGIGAYEFTCIPHYSLGMHGIIYVLENPPAPPPAAPSFEPFWWILIIVVSLAVASVVLGIIYGKRSPEDDAIPADAPLTSRPEYFNDSRPEPLDSVEPMKRSESDE